MLHKTTEGPIDSSVTGEVDIRQRYQDSTYAERYHRATATDSCIRLETLAARTISILERRCVARAMRECQPSPALVLDVPCGAGKLGDVLAAASTQVVSADLSVPMIQVARQAYEASHFSGFVCSNAEQLPFRTAAFDMVVCLRLMHLVPPASRGSMIKELARVTSRRLIVSYGVVGLFQSFRLKIRRAILRGISTPYPVHLSDLLMDFEGAGLRVKRQRHILPILSSECLFTLEKVQGDRSAS